MKRGGRIPRLTIELELEGSPQVTIFADGLADEMSLRGWLLSNPMALYALGGFARRVLEGIERPDESERAA